MENFLFFKKKKSKILSLESGPSDLKEPWILNFKQRDTEEDLDQ